jgi:type IV pilus assembly protein PilC
MTTFKYTAVKPDGQRVRGNTRADTIKLAMAGLMDQSFDVVDLKESKSVLQFEITKKKLPPAEVMHFSRQLGAFVRAGVPLIEAIEVIEEEAENKVLRRVLAAVREELRTGETFSSALAPFQTMFPQFYVDMLRAAELTGTLDNVLDEISRYIERDLDARQKIRSAMVYPLVVLVMAIITITVLAVYVLPRFKDFFASLGAKLPLPTRMLIGLTDFLGNWWWALLGGIVLIVVGFALLFRAHWGRRLRDRTLLKLWVVGEVVRYTIVERFCRLLASMMEAGVPLPEAMTVLGRGTNNVIFQEGLASVREAMVRGQGIAAPMAASKLFPGAVIQMVRVGEDTGSLDQQLEAAAAYFDKELDYKIKKLTSLFEPAVILVMGAIVGFVAIALISAMYGIFNQDKIS